MQKSTKQSKKNTRKRNKLQTERELMNKGRESQDVVPKIRTSQTKTQ